MLQLDRDVLIALKCGTERNRTAKRLWIRFAASSFFKALLVGCSVPVGVPEIELLTAPEDRSARFLHAPESRKTRYVEVRLWVYVEAADLGLCCLHIYLALMEHPFKHYVHVQCS